MSQAIIQYRDQTITFPAVDDVERMDPRKLSDRRLAFSASGVPESVFLLPYEESDFSIEDVVTESFTDELEAWWSHARRGQAYSFAFDNADTALTALEANAASGVTAMQISDIADLVVDGRYLLMQDLLGRNTSRNELPSTQSQCEASGDFTFTGTPGVGTQVVTPKVGTWAIEFESFATNDTMEYTATIAVPTESFLTFSLWYRDNTDVDLRLFMSSGALKFTATNLAITSDSDWHRATVAGFFPDAVSTVKVGIERTGGAGTDYIDVDAWQLEYKQHATPWVDGVTTALQKTAATKGHAQIIKVASFASSPDNTVNFTPALKFDFKVRDALRSILYWERAVSMDASSPLRLKPLTSTITHRFREVP